jgi:hypothetical protein
MTGGGLLGRDAPKVPGARYPGEKLGELALTPFNNPEAGRFPSPQPVVEAQPTPPEHGRGFVIDPGGIEVAASDRIPGVSAKPAIPRRLILRKALSPPEGCHDHAVHEFAEKAVLSTDYADFTDSGDESARPISGLRHQVLNL